MATFPESSPSPNYPLNLRMRFATNKVGLGGDNIVSQRRSSVVFPVYDVSVPYASITAVEAQTIWNFFKARAGGQEAFYIYDLSLLALVAPAHVGEFCGLGDGATVTFDIPGRSTSSQTIYMAGVAQTPTTEYTISYGTGDSGADQAVFVTPPAAGNTITADFTGFLRCRVIFKNDVLDRELFLRDLMRYRSIELEGVEALA